jgi:hypothetical protein
LKPTPFEAPCIKVRGIFHAREMSIYWCSLANPRSKLRGMRSLSLFQEENLDPKKEKIQIHRVNIILIMGQLLTALKGNKITPGKPAVWLTFFLF